MEYLPSPERALVREFAWIPDEIAFGMVGPLCDNDIEIPFENTFASMGDLDRIPTEMMHIIFEDCTMEDLAALRKTCQLTRAMVPGLLAFKDLTWYVPNMLRALSEMGLLGSFTVRHLMATLSSHICVGCGNFAACVFIPDFSRCCYTCLQYNEAFWVMPQEEARRCFNLGDEIDELIPYYWSIPGRYEMANEPPVYSDGSKKMVSVRAARALALETWGEQDLKNHLSGLYVFQMFDHVVLGRYRHLHHTPLEIGPAHHPPQRSDNYYYDHNGWPGMGAMLIPIIIKQRFGNTIVETGVWCRGCAHASNEWRNFIREEKLLVKEHAIQEQRAYKTQDKVSMMMQCMEWASELFLNHAHHCYGLSLWKREHDIPELPGAIDFDVQLQELIDGPTNMALDSDTESDPSDVSADF